MSCTLFRTYSASVIGVGLIIRVYMTALDAYGKDHLTVRFPLAAGQTQIPLRLEAAPPSTLIAVTRSKRHHGSAEATLCRNGGLGVVFTRRSPISEGRRVYKKRDSLEKTFTTKPCVAVVGIPDCFP